MILFLNHKVQNCGVYQLGRRVGLALVGHVSCGVIYSEVDNSQEYEFLIANYTPNMIVYNYYPSTMPWLNERVIQGHRDLVHIALFHEVPTTIFDYYLHLDPTYVENGVNFTIGRLIPEYKNQSPLPEIPTIGSFGFGLGGKGYDLLARKVNVEFDNAIIRLHIPCAAFGDAAGVEARKWADRARDNITKPGIHVSITHDFLPENELLDFLAQNTVNAFYYEDMYGRGCASVADYALAVGRPMAITKSYMFRHLHPYAPQICMEDNSLPDIIAAGTEPLVQFMKWDKQHLITKFEEIYDLIKNVKRI